MEVEVERCKKTIEGGKVGGWKEGKKGRKVKFLGMVAG